MFCVTSVYTHVAEIETVHLVSLPPHTSMASPMVVSIASLDDADDVSGWINGILDDGLEDDALGTLDGRVAQLVSTVQVASHDTSAQLEQTIEQVSRAVPRLTYDLQFMRDSALSLHASLHSVQTQSTPASVDASTASALDRLAQLHKVKGRMEAVRDVLREAESWSTLESEVVALLQESAYDRAAERLAEARRSMSVFQSSASSPEHETRRALIVSLQNQLEAALSAALVSAVTAGDVAACRRFYAIFNNIERASEFRNYYNGARRSQLVETWAAARLQDCDPEDPTLASSSVQKLSEFLLRWLNDFAQLVNAECASVAQIFPDPQLSLSNLIQSVFDSLSPSLSQRLSSAVDYHGAKNAILELINSYRAAEEFARGTERAMEKLQFASALTISPSSGTGLSAAEEVQAKRTSRHSKRLSMSMRGGVGKSISIPTSGIQQINAAATQWAPSLFEPFMPFQGDYPALEGRYLAVTLPTGASTSLSGTIGSTSASDERGDAAARRLRTRLIDFFNSSDDALARCLSLTHGLAFPGLLQTLDGQFKTFLQSQLKVCLDSKAGSHTTPLSGSGSEEFALQLDYTDADLRAFQMTLHLLETAQDADSRLATLEGRLRIALVGVAVAVRTPQAHSTTPHGHHLSPSQQLQSQQAVPSASIQMLVSSTLNSAELHALLDSVVDPPPNVPPATAGLQAPSTAGLVPPSTAPPGTTTFSATPTSPSFGRKALPTMHSTTPSKPPPVLLPGARTALATFTRDTQSFLQRTILAPLITLLSSYSTQEFGASSSTAGSSGGISGINLPSFGLSPTKVMQRLADGVLSLPQLFEVYAADDALGYSLATLPHGPATLRTAAAPTDLSSPIAPAQPEDEDDPTSEWLASIVRHLIAHLTHTSLPAISKLTTQGAKQLAYDLEYLGTVVRTFGVEVTPPSAMDNGIASNGGAGSFIGGELDLGLWKEVLEMDEKALRGEEGLQVEHIAKQVRRMRGW